MRGNSVIAASKTNQPEPTMTNVCERALGDHAAETVLVGLPRAPARTGTGPGPERRFDANQLDARMLARHLHEAAHVRPRLPGEQRLASGRRTVMDEVGERGVVGQKRHRLMDEVQNGDADRLSPSIGK